MLHRVITSIMFLVTSPVCVAGKPKSSDTQFHVIEPHWNSSSHGSLLSMTVSPNENILVTGGTLPGGVSSFGDLFVGKAFTDDPRTQAGPGRRERSPVPNAVPW